MRWYRRIHIGVVLVALAAIGLLTLSDSVRPLRPMARAVGSAGRLVADTTGTGGVGRPDLPIALDTFGHFAAWGAIGFLAAGLARRGAERFSLFVGLLALSAAAEVGQKYLSWSRTAAFADLVANGVGLTLGFLIGGLLHRIVGATVRRVRHLRRLRMLAYK